MPEKLSALEAALSALAPASARLDRDALMYAAGRQGNPHRRWIWPALAASFALLAAGLGARLATISPTVIDRTIVVRERIPTEADPDSAPPLVEPNSPPDSRIALEPPVGGPYLGQLMRAMDRGELPAPANAPAVAGARAAPPARSWEHDLDLPPGSLRELGSRHYSSSSLNP